MDLPGQDAVESIENSFKVNWKPVLKIMDSAIVNIESPSLEMTAIDLEEWYAARMHMLWF